MNLARATGERSGDFIQSLQRGLLVINSFSRDHPSQTLSEVAERTGLTRATSRRILLTLTELGYVDQKGRAFALTPRVLDLGYSFLSSFHVVEIAALGASRRRGPRIVLYVGSRWHGDRLRGSRPRGS